MCANCQARDAEIKLELGESSPAHNHIEQRALKIRNDTDKDIPLNSRHYHVNVCKSIVQIEDDIRANPENGTDEEKNFIIAQYLEHRIQEFQARMFKRAQEQESDKIYVMTDQRYLNQLVPKLRDEYREKFRKYDISYKPNIQKISTPRASKVTRSEKAQSGAAALFNISPEEFKRRMEEQLKNVLGIKCTCSETPGICRLHPVKS